MTTHNRKSIGLVDKLLAFPFHHEVKAATNTARAPRAALFSANMARFCFQFFHPLYHLIE
jgi:hypothetical protein